VLGSESGAAVGGGVYVVAAGDVQRRLDGDGGPAGELLQLIARERDGVIVLCGVLDVVHAAGDGGEVARGDGEGVTVVAGDGRVLRAVRGARRAAAARARAAAPGERRRGGSTGEDDGEAEKIFARDGCAHGALRR